MTTDVASELDDPPIVTRRAGPDRQHHRRRVLHETAGVTAEDASEPGLRRRLSAARSHRRRARRAEGRAGPTVSRRSHATARGPAWIPPSRVGAGRSTTRRWAATARHSLCQFWNDWNQNSYVVTICHTHARLPVRGLLRGELVGPGRRLRSTMAWDGDTPLGTSHTVGRASSSCVTSQVTPTRPSSSRASGPRSHRLVGARSRVTLSPTYHCERGVWSLPAPRIGVPAATIGRVGQVVPKVPRPGLRVPILDHAQRHRLLRRRRALGGRPASCGSGARRAGSPCRLRIGRRPR
jgi:hypothetical protein